MNHFQTTIGFICSQSPYSSEHISFRVKSCEGNHICKESDFNIQIENLLNFDGSIFGITSIIKIGNVTKLTIAHGSRIVIDEDISEFVNDNILYQNPYIYQDVIGQILQTSVMVIENICYSGSLDDIENTYSMLNYSIKNKIKHW